MLLRDEGVANRGATKDGMACGGGQAGYWRTTTGCFGARRMSTSGVEEDRRSGATREATVTAVRRHSARRRDRDSNAKARRRQPSMITGLCLCAR